MLANRKQIGILLHAMHHNSLALAQPITQQRRQHKKFRMAEEYPLLHVEIVGIPAVLAWGGAGSKLAVVDWGCAYYASFVGGVVVLVVLPDFGLYLAESFHVTQQFIRVFLQVGSLENNNLIGHFPIFLGSPLEDAHILGNILNLIQPIKQHLPRADLIFIIVHRHKMPQTYIPIVQLVGECSQQHVAEYEEYLIFCELEGDVLLLAEHGYLARQEVAVFYHASQDMAEGA